MAQAAVEEQTLRVLCVHTATRPPLGADTWIHAQIIRHLDRSTHEVHVACAPGPAGSPTPTYRELHGIPDIHLRTVNFGPEFYGSGLRSRLKTLVATLPAVTSIVRLIRYVRRHRIPVIHTSDRPRDAFACLLIARLTKAKCIVHVHVGYNPDWMGWMLRSSLRHADALIAVSEFVARTLIEGGHGASRVHAVLNAIEVESWVPGAGRAAVRQELAIADSTSVVVTVCRLFPEKGPADLIRAIGELRKDVPDVLLLVVGQPLYRAYGDELAALVQELGLGEYVKFLQRRDDVAAVMAASEVFAMPSHEEPFGLVFLEAMAMCLPVVAVADGGTLEVVEHGKSGLLSNYGDIDQLTANLRLLLLDRALRAELGRYGRRRVEERFTATRMAADVARVYRLVASSVDHSDRAPREGGRAEPIAS